MITERSCGAIVYTREGNCIKYVIVRSKEGIYGFPKGHMEGMESETETALREILEETGVRVQLIDGFKTEVSYSFIRNGEKRLKHIVYFLGEYSDQTPVAQKSELSSLHLMDLSTAISMLQYEDSKRLLREAHNFLMRS